MMRSILLCTGAALLTGCAASGPATVSSQQQQSCTIQLTASPQSGSADHSAKPPANQVQFTVMYGPSAQSACKLPTAIITSATWTSSDSSVQVDSVPGPGNGTATCVAATSSPATLTASYTPMGAATMTANATMACQ